MNTETEFQHSKMVAILKKRPEVIKQELTTAKCDLMHMTFGICGEAGELLDAVKKCIIYNQPLDTANVIEELGDIEFYIQGLLQILNLTRDEVLKQNLAKLSKRYEKLIYSDQAAQERKDKNA